ncbi:MAG TPA: glycosyltransferase family 4 protein, partial [Methanomassiliicoccales archaeon]|nr:glycosyltransferase family 4 protein [Methanomassiliicoccales archaeon]
MIETPDGEKAQVFNGGNLKNPYLNGMLFTVRNMLGYSRGIEKLLRKDFVKNDDRVLFHVHDPYVLGLAHKLKRKFPGSHVVYDRHEYYDAWRNRLGFSSPGLLEKLYSRCVDEVVIVSRDYKGKIKNLEERPVSVVPNYPLVRSFSPEAVKDKLKEFERTGRTEAVYFGVLNLDFDRDIRLMFELAEGMMSADERINFTVAGRIDHEGVWPLIKQAEERFPQQMRYLGEIPYSEVVRRTQEAHLGFLLLDPSNLMFSEEMPNSSNKVYEYLLSGTVPVVRAVIDDSQVISGCSLLFDRNATKEDMLKDMLELTSDRERMAAMMRRCYEIGSTLSWEDFSKEYLNIYERLFRSM